MHRYVYTQIYPFDTSRSKGCAELTPINLNSGLLFTHIHLPLPGQQHAYKCVCVVGWGASLCPVVKTPRFQCRGHRFYPCLEKIPYAAQYGQREKQKQKPGCVRVYMCTHTQTYTFYFLNQGRTPRLWEPAAVSSKAGLPPVHLYTLTVQRSPSDSERAPLSPKGPSLRSRRSQRMTCQ